MDKELLKELIKRIKMCQNSAIDTCDCDDCPLYKLFGNEQDICDEIVKLKNT